MFNFQIGKNKKQNQQQEQLKLEDKRPNQSEQTSSEASEDFSSSQTSQNPPQNDEPTHFDGLIKTAETAEQQQEEQQRQQQEEISDGGILTLEEFHASWCEMTDFASFMTDLRSLKDHKDDARVRGFTGGVYNRLKANAYLRQLLNPKSGLMMDMTAIFMYVVAKRKAIRAELAERQPAPQKNAAQPEKKPEPQKGQEPSDVPTQEQAAALVAG